MERLVAGSGSGQCRHRRFPVTTYRSRSDDRSRRLGQDPARVRGAHMRRRVLSSPRKQRGIALMVAILLVAFATILAAAIGFKSAMSARRGSATLALDQSVLIAEAAEALAAYALREDAKASKTFDYQGDAWGMPIGPVEVLPGITLEAYLQYVSGK